MGEINQRILLVRKHFELTQAEMAQKCKVSQSNQSRYERNFDIPYSYLSKLMDQFPSLNPCWLCSGRESMLKTPDRKVPKKIAPEEEGLTRHFDDIREENLTKAEADLLDEVKQFSDFLKTRGLSLYLKRSLLQLLIEHIDQAIQSYSDIHYDEDDN